MKAKWIVVPGQENSVVFLGEGCFGCVYYDLRVPRFSISSFFIALLLGWG